MVQPNSCKPCANPAKRAGSCGSSTAVDINTPMRRTRSPCCARAAIGHATAPPPSSVMNARRLMLNLPLQSRFTAPQPCHRAARRVPWTDLNCSERSELLPSPNWGGQHDHAPGGRGPLGSGRMKTSWQTSPLVLGFRTYWLAVKGVEMCQQETLARQFDHRTVFTRTRLN